MPDEPSVPEGMRVPRLRWWGDRKPPKNKADVFSSTIQNAADTDDDTAAGPIATLRMYGPIDSWGWPFGISAQDVSGALDSLGDEVTEVRVRINSPGGDAFEGMAILNMLRAHPAKVVAIVDGVAASAASYIAAGCEETVMSPGTQMMIHDASGFAYGDEATMAKAARWLASTSNSIASVYADAAGGGVGKWRKAMVEETWYTADEAVNAKLADRVAVVPDVGRTTTAGEGEPPTLPDEVENQFDLSMFNYAGRSHAPAPAASAASETPAASASGNPTEEATAVAFSDEQITNLRNKLGVSEDADEATILAALDEALEERADDADETPTAPEVPEGMTLIESDVLEELQTAASQGQEAHARFQREDRDREISNAVQAGKITPARAEHWQTMFDADPEGTKATLAGLPAGLAVPVEKVGNPGDPDLSADNALYTELFPEEQKAS